MRNCKWSEKEIEFLRNNYDKGCDYVSNELNRSLYSVRGKAGKLKLKKHKYETFCDIDELREVVKICNSYKDICVELNKTKGGATYKIIKRIVEKYDIDISHFNPFKREMGKIKYGVGYPIEYWLNNGTNISSSNLKKKLYDEGFKDRLCEMCGQGEDWCGYKMSLILDHINGVNDDNRLINLRIVCPNCNATLPTHCRGHKGIKDKEV